MCLVSIHFICRKTFHKNTFEINFSFVFPYREPDIFFKVFFYLICVLYNTRVTNQCFITRGFNKYFRLDLFSIQFLASTLQLYINTCTFHLNIILFDFSKVKCHVWKSRGNIIALRNLKFKS